MSAPATALRPRSGSELIDAAFVILRRNYTEFVAIMAVFLVPGIVLSLLIPGPAGRLAEVFFRLLSLPAAGAVIAAASDAYLGREVTVGDSARRGASRWLSLFGAAFIQGFMIIVGFILLIVPAFIFFAWTAVMPAVVMLEHAGAGDSFTRSRALAKGDTLRILGMIGLTTLVVFMLTFAVTAGIAIMSGVGADGEARMAEAAGNVVTILVYPIVPVVTTLLYYDLRIRKEGFDLELLAGSLDAEPGTSAAGGGGATQRANRS